MSHIRWYIGLVIRESGTPAEQIRKAQLRLASSLPINDD